MFKNSTLPSTSLRTSFVGLDLGDRHEIRDYDRQIQALCRDRYPQALVLRRVGGVGPLTALAFILTLEDPSRFRTSSRPSTSLTSSGTLCGLPALCRRHTWAGVSYGKSREVGPALGPVAKRPSTSNHHTVPVALPPVERPGPQEWKSWFPPRPGSNPFAAPLPPLETRLRSSR